MEENATLIYAAHHMLLCSGLYLCQYPTVTRQYIWILGMYKPFMILPIKNSCSIIEVFTAKHIPHILAVLMQTIGSCFLPASMMM